MGRKLQHLLQVDVVQVVGAAHSLHHPALWGDHVKGKQGRLREVQESGGGTRRHRVISHEGHFWFQDVAVKAAETHAGEAMSVFAGTKKRIVNRVGVARYPKP